MSLKLHWKLPSQSPEGSGKKTMGQLSKKENKIFFFLIFMSPILGFRTYNKSTQNHIVSCSAAATTKFVSFLVKDRWVIQKYKNEMIFAKNFARNYEKNTWNIRRLVNETIIPSTQRIILKIVGSLFQEGGQMHLIKVSSYWQFP